MTYEKKQLFRWRQVKRNKQELHLCTRMLVSGLLVSAVGIASADPSLIGVSNGLAVIAVNSNQTNIDQQSNRVDIDWSSFDTNAGYDVNFFQPSATAVAINRITGAQTQFNGNLNANGQVFLLNQNGFIFGASSSINVGSLLATTSALEIEEATEARSLVTSSPSPYRFSGSNYAQIIQNGTVTFSPGGYAALVAPYVENSGTIQVGWTQTGPSGPFDWTGAPPNPCNKCDWTAPESFPRFERYNGSRSQIELASATDFELFTGNRGSFDSPDVSVGVSFGPTNLITYQTQASILFTTDGGEGAPLDPNDFPLGVKNTGTLQAESGNIFLRAPLSGTVQISTSQIEELTQGVVQGFTALPDATQITADGFLDVEGGDIHIAGTINADEHADREGSGGYIRADAGRNITFDGADIHAIGGEQVAGAFWADGDIQSTDSATTIDLQALDSAEGSTAADADLVMDAGEGIAFNGDINVLASANFASTSEGYGGSGGSASAEAHATFNAHDGDVAITTATSTVRVQAIADNSASSGTQDASAGAYLHIRSSGNTSVTGHTVVDAQAKGYGNATTYADETIIAGDGGSYGGDVTINGNTDISALSEKLSGSDASADTAYAYADQYIYAGDNYGGAGGNIAITGNTSLTAKATNSGTYSTWSNQARANVYRYLDAGDAQNYGGSYGGGDITLTGDSILSADAFSNAGYAYANGTQVADGGDGAYYGGDGGSVSVTGDTKMTAKATTGDLSRSSADAYLDQYIYAGDGGYGGGNGGDITIVGDSNVTSVAYTNSDDDASAGVDQYFYAGDIGSGNYNGDGGDITITGDTLLSAKSTVASDSGSASAEADQILQAGAGGFSGNGGDVVITGDTTIEAIGLNLEPSSDDSENDVDAHQSIYGGDGGYGGSISITGDTAISATAHAHSYEASANASQLLQAGSSRQRGGNIAGDVTIDGDVMVKADAAASYSSYAYANASQDIIANDISITGDTSVTANAVAWGSSVDGTAYAYIDYQAQGDVTIDGDLTSKATADTTSSSYYSGDAYAEASLNIQAGKDGSGSLEITGDVLVDGKAFSLDGTAYAWAEASLRAANDVTITTDTSTVEVSATAERAGFGYISDVPFAHALLEIEAGDQDVEREFKGINTGSLTINGNVDVNASAKNISSSSGYYYGDGYGGAEAEAFGVMSALGDVDITGDVSVAATSLSEGGYSNYYYPHGGEGDLTSLFGNGEDRIPGAEAWLTIVAGVNLDALHDYGFGEGPSVPADLNLTGNVTVKADARSDTGTWFNWLDGTGGGEDSFAPQGIGLGGPGGFEGTYGYYTPAAAIGIMTATNDLTVKGDVNVSAYAEDTGSMMIGKIYDGEFLRQEPIYSYGSNTPVAISGLAMVSGLDPTGNGGGMDMLPQVLSLDEDEDEYDGSYEEGFFTNGALSYTGDINVDADAIGRNDAWAIGAALLLGGGDVFINTDPVIVDANATIEGSYYGYGEGTAVALAGLVTVAGINDFEEGDASLDIAEGDVRIDFHGDGDPHHLTVLGNLEANARTNVPDSGPISGPERVLPTQIGVDGGEGYVGYAGALTALVATGDIDVHGNDPLASANSARAQERQTVWQGCAYGSCRPESFGLFDWADIGEASGETENPSDRSLSLAQLIIAAGGDVSIEPKNNFLDLITPYEEPTPIPTGDPGNLPLRFAANGDMLVATGTGVTTPPSIEPMNLDIEAALAAGGDPSTLLAPTAAGPGSQEGLASGQDAYTTTGPDFCDKLVAGACLDGTPGEGSTQ